jgi:hypothetical protein
VTARVTLWFASQAACLQLLNSVHKYLSNEARPLSKPAEQPAGKRRDADAAPVRCAIAPQERVDVAVARVDRLALLGRVFVRAAGAADRRHEKYRELRLHGAEHTVTSTGVITLARGVCVRAPSRAAARLPRERRR